MISCTECNQQLRVPVLQKVIRVTCKSCGHLFFVHPNGNSGQSTGNSTTGKPAGEKNRKAGTAGKVWGCIGIAIALLFLLGIVAQIAQSMKGSHLKEQRAKDAQQQLATEKMYESDVAGYERDAARGDGKAMAALGGHYENGWGVPQDYAKAVALYQQAVHAGYAYAWIYLGLCYQLGHGVPLNYSFAADCYRNAINKGVTAAEPFLGNLYERGWGVSQGYAKAAQLYYPAANRGEPGPQYSLGRLYEYGLGVPKDMNQAVAWYRRAALQDQPDAKSSLARLGLPGR